MFPQDKLDFIYSLVKRKLKLEDDTDRSVIEDSIISIGLRIKHYCAIDKIHEQLFYVWADMVSDACRVDLTNYDAIDDSVVVGGESIKVGDTSIKGGSTGGSGGGITPASKNVIDDLVFEYRHDLNRYRKLRW